MTYEKRSNSGALNADASFPNSPASSPSGELTTTKGEEKKAFGEKEARSDNVSSPRQITRQLLSEIANALIWLDEFVEIPETFPSEGDYGWWCERRQGIRNLARKLNLSSQGVSYEAIGVSSPNPSRSLPDAPESDGGETKKDLEGKEAHPESVNPVLQNALYDTSYTYDDVLAAYIVGRTHQRKYGDGEGDAPDFLTWLKARLAAFSPSNAAGAAKVETEDSREERGAPEASHVRQNALLSGINHLTRPDYHALNVHCGRNDRLLHAVLCAYAKWHLDNPDIGSEQLSDILYNAICESIGDKAFVEWVNTIKGE